VRYSGYQAAIAIDDFAVVAGRLPPRVLGLVIEWATVHQIELRANWERAARREPLQPVAPLE
jgi:hypothetical protein